jgi:hypothetical protein
MLGGLVRQGREEAAWGKYPCSESRVDDDQ